MKQATFFEGVGFALFASLVGASGFVTLTSIFAGGTVFRLLIAGISLVYILYLLARSKERVGRITTVAIFLIVTIVSWLFVPSTLMYILIQLGMVWLLRSLYFYSSVLSSLVDLALTGLSLAIAIWVWLTTNSLFLGFWSFFLVQALFVFIPRKLARSHGRHTARTHNDDPFERAHRAAEMVLRNLISTH
jgi:amino acid transporter